MYVVPLVSIVYILLSLQHTKRRLLLISSHWFMHLQSIHWLSVGHYFLHIYCVFIQTSFQSFTRTLSCGRRRRSRNIYAVGAAQALSVEPMALATDSRSNELLRTICAGSRRRSQTPVAVRSSCYAAAVDAAAAPSDLRSSIACVLRLCASIMKGFVSFASKLTEAIVCDVNKSSSAVKWWHYCYEF